MTNLDAAPDEVLCEAGQGTEPDIVMPRDVPLGGIRAMTVRRTLPARGRPFVGPWCFLDHYGPDDVAQTGGMDVAPHPHCGLQTVSWLFRGEIEHRDSLGTREIVLPGELNLMTSGHGIAHSEVSTRATTVLQGVQLWVALPADRRDIRAAFQHYAPPTLTDAGVSRRVFLGELEGETSPVPTHSPIVGAELSFGADAMTEFAVYPEFEHGILVDSGTVEVSFAGAGGVSLGTHRVSPEALAALPTGLTRLQVRAMDGPARILLIGGTPMVSDLVMWWNFVGGSHDEIVEAREQWQVEIGAGDANVAANAPVGAPPRYGTVLGYDGAPLPAPRMPGGRLRPRRPADRR